MQSPSQPRHPSQILQDIRSEYEKRNNLTTQAAQKHLSKMCQWKESTWGNLERSTLVSGQEWKDDYTSDMVEGSVIKENSRYHKELIAWERIRDAAAGQSDREEYLQQQAREQQAREQQAGEQQAGEQQSDPTPGDPPTEAVKEDNNVVNGDNNGGGRGQDKRKWYWIAGLGGCAVLLLLCALGVTTAYLYVQRDQLARQTPTPPVVIEKEVTRIVEMTRIVEATVVVEKPLPEVTRPPSVVTGPATPEPMTPPAVQDTKPTTPQQLPALAYGRLLYEETFERDTETWAIWDGSRIHDGELVIVPDAGAHPHSDEQYSEFIFEVEFRPKDQAPNPEFTIFVHFQVPQCTIPQCGIVTSVKAVQKVITVRKHTETETVRIISDVPARQLDPNRWNKVTIVAKGEEYQIFVNDTYVDSFTDSTYTRGKFLLWAEGGGGGRGPIAVNAVRVYAVP